MKQVFLVLILFISSTTIAVPSGERKAYPCTICGKFFSQNFHRKRHELIHQNIKPFMCILCGYESNQQSNMNTHLKMHCRLRLTCSWGCGYYFPELRLKAHQKQFGKEGHFKKVRQAVLENSSRQGKRSKIIQKSKQKSRKLRKSGPKRYGLLNGPPLDIVAEQREEPWCSRRILKEREKPNNDPLLCEEFFSGSLFFTITTESLSDKYGGMSRFAPGWTRKIKLRNSVSKRQKRKKHSAGYEGDDDEPTSPIKPRKKKKKTAESKSLDDFPDMSWDEFFATIEAEPSDLELEPVVTACGDYAPATCSPRSNSAPLEWWFEDEASSLLDFQENP